MSVDWYARHLRYSACRTRTPEVRRGILVHYARIHAESGWGTGGSEPLPKHYQVVGQDVPWPYEKG
ncbi:hypothetical protein [Methylobacterium nodulans]|uniref:Uncharacterized protein n=1 Tax=Methylobacterium nodulans (strain LMG 21967 / CNCM I-2342 / ORS 2060) TaxID=460265 RepID=B8IEQ6_METNO|nr:hypothetical protein [Methylobacterium nodulans]ACL61399.1 hypothetical protein Mnod_6632 [Methylobacterium nodulans ORS 2060]